MIDFEDNTPEAGGRSSGRLEAIATFAVAVALLAVVGANVLSKMLENGDLPVIAFLHPEQGLQRLAKAAPRAPAPQTVTIVRSVGVDGITTATIPHSPANATALTPCGESGKQ